VLVKSARAAFESVDRSYERAARTLGASEWRLFWRVTLPWPTARFSLLPRSPSRDPSRFRRYADGAAIFRPYTDRRRAIYDAVESGEGAVARTLVLVVSAIALLILTLANRLSPRY